MTTDFEIQHPRKGTGRFDQKPQSAPDLPALEASLIYAEPAVPVPLIDAQLRIGVARATAQAAEAEYQAEVVRHLSTYLERQFPGAGRITFRCDPEAGYETPEFRSALRGNVVLLDHTADDERIRDIGEYAAQLNNPYAGHTQLSRVRRQDWHEKLYSLDLEALRSQPHT
jgi:hypothetical protein